MILNLKLLSLSLATGFLAYSKVNPFAAAIANSSNSFKSFGTFGSKFSSSSAEKTGVNQLQPSSSAPPSVIPSPKSPKFNPFSSPSPAHNPFMTIVDGKDDWWSKMASSKSDTESAGGFFSKDEVEKSKQISDGCEKDSPVGGDDDDRPDDDNTGNQVYTKIYPMPENVVVLTGEENDECLLVTRAKMYRLDIDPRNVSGSSQTNGEAEKEVDASSHDKSSEGLEEKVILDELKSDNHEKEKDVAQGKTSNPEWIEVGVGPLKLLKTNSTGGSSFVRLVMRREDKKGGIGMGNILLFMKI